MIALAGSASAHITLLNPNGGEMLTVGSTFTIEWTINIAHNQQNWDIWYSTEGPTSGFVEIAMNQAPGATNAGSNHTYEWTVPDVVANQVWVRVRMDNAGTDYFDVSNASFSIVPADVCLADVNGDGMVTPTDFTAWINAFNNNLPECDQNGDGACTPTDFTAWIANFNAGCP